MKINDAKIRNDLQQFSVPAYDRDKMQETIRVSKKAYNERLLSKRIGFCEFIATQVRFIGRWVWLSQATFLLLSLYLLSRFNFGKVDMQSVFLLLSSVASLIAFVGFPEVLKSYANNMEEIEACTRFSMRKLMGARMLILGLADLCSLTIILTVSTAGNAALILRMIYIPVRSLQYNLLHLYDGIASCQKQICRILLRGYLYRRFGDLAHTDLVIWLLRSRRYSRMDNSIFPFPHLSCDRNYPSFL